MTSASPAAAAPAAPAAATAGGSSFPHNLSKQECRDLDTFITHHSAHSRPIALVTSGGTAADLEVHTVRSLENFSTGLRGALSVERLLAKGYAVIHLWRTGSAAPYARALATAGMSGKERLWLPNQGLSVQGFDRMLALNGDNQDDDPLDGLDDNDDPWLEDLVPSSGSNKSAGSRKKQPVVSSGVSLNRRLADSPNVLQAVRDLRRHRDQLLTVPFRTVEEYLGRLEHCARALQPCRSLVLLYLAAAVSDFYVPDDRKATHKLSLDPINGTMEVGNELVLRLYPVPKVLSALRHEWAPQAFCVSFKLETDPAVLRKKAQKAVDQYGVHMVIGNILETRHQTVWLLQAKDRAVEGPDDKATETMDWIEVSKPSHTGAVLEDALLDRVAQQHFLHIANEHPAVAQRTQELMNAKRRRLQQELFWQRVYDGTVQVGGTLLGMALTYTISLALRRKIVNGN